MNPYGIRNGHVSVPWFSVDMPDLLASALEYARRKNRMVNIWSNDYRSGKCTRYAHLEAVVLPDGRSDSPYIMQVGGTWCACAYPDHDTMLPKGLAAAKAAYDSAGDYRDIYRGWETQPRG